MIRLGGHCTRLNRETEPHGKHQGHRARRAQYFPVSVCVVRHVTFLVALA